MRISQDIRDEFGGQLDTALAQDTADAIADLGLPSFPAREDKVQQERDRHLNVAGEQSMAEHFRAGGSQLYLRDRS